MRSRPRAAHDCDSDKSKALLDGTLVVRQLATVFADGSAYERGVHAGDFLWRATSLVVQGRLQGITNAGLNRRPLRQACEECRGPGVMIGRLCGAHRALGRPHAPGRTGHGGLPVRVRAH